MREGMAVVVMEEEGGMVGVAAVEMEEEGMVVMVEVGMEIMVMELEAMRANSPQLVVKITIVCQNWCLQILTPVEKNSGVGGAFLHQKSSTSLSAIPHQQTKQQAAQDLPSPQTFKGMKRTARRPPMWLTVGMTSVM